MSLAQKLHDCREAIRDAVNRFSIDNMYNTPDYVLAEYLMRTLVAFGSAQSDAERHRTHVTCEDPGDDVCKWTNEIGRTDDGRYVVCATCKSRLNLDSIYRHGHALACPVCGASSKGRASAVEVDDG